MSLFSFKEYITEVFSQPYKWKWTVEKHLQHKEYGDFFQFDAKFETANGDVIVVVLEGENSEQSDGIHISFLRNDSYDVTDGGDAFRIFATVFEIIKNFISKFKPRMLKFLSEPFKNGKTTDKSGRTKLYTTMVRKFANQNGYAYNQSKRFGSIEFTLIRKD